MADLAGSVGFGVADRGGCGPADDADVVDGEFDGEGHVADVDGDVLSGVEAAEGDLLSAHHDHPGVAGSAVKGLERVRSSLQVVATRLDKLAVRYEAIRVATIPLPGPEL